MIFDFEIPKEKYITFSLVLLMLLFLFPDMIERIAHSILFDDVLDELKETIPLLVETKGSPYTDVRTLTDHGE